MASKITIFALLLTFTLLCNSSSALKLRVWGEKDPECIADGGYCRLVSYTGANDYCDKYKGIPAGIIGAADSCSPKDSKANYKCCLEYGRYKASEPCLEMCTSEVCGSDRVPGKCEGANEYCCVLVV